MNVAAASSCGRGSTAPFANRSTVSTRTSAPIDASRSPREPASSPGSIASARWRITGPVSIPASITIVVTPVSTRPSSSAVCTGLAPRSSGSNEKCRFTGAIAGRSSTACGRISP